jgi:hypothetical protein
MKPIHATLAFLLLTLGAVAVQFQVPEVDVSALSKRQSTPYWYEIINHQGISAFGPSGYAVYRNVKDYGAKGESQLELVNRPNILI